MIYCGPSSLQPNDFLSPRCCLRSKCFDNVFVMIKEYWTLHLYPTVYDGLLCFSSLHSNSREEDLVGPAIIQVVF